MLTMQVNPPQGHSPTEPIFLAGSINGWIPDDDRYQLTFDEASQGFILSLEVPADGLAYKFTRGSWASEEATLQGEPIANRQWQSQQDGVVLHLQIDNWRDYVKSDDQMGNVFCWQDALYLPELNRHRRIWVYLPPKYEQNFQQFPVLYMHDAQNLFADETSPDNWHVGHTLNRLYTQTGWGCIVVGIEHGNEHRLAEYSTVAHPEHGGGDGQAYLRFLVGTLKPMVDATFRTRPDAAHTAMIGSSMGGLISLYAALQYGDIFGKVAAFSPSLWWSDDIYRAAAAVPYQFVHTLVLLGGQRESPSMLPDLLALYYTLVDNGYFEHKIQLDFYNDGSHAEWFWGRELERAIRWLFSETITPLQEPPFAQINKAAREIQLVQPFLKADLLNGYGKVIYSLDGSSEQSTKRPSFIPLRPHWRGLFALKCLLPNQRIELKKISL